jgi:hypothetical protein
MLQAATSQLGGAEEGPGMIDAVQFHHVWLEEEGAAADVLMPDGGSVIVSALGDVEVRMRDNTIVSTGNLYTDASQTFTTEELALALDAVMVHYHHSQAVAANDGSGLPAISALQHKIEGILALRNHGAGS